jgi:hypothetical protein
MGPAVTLVVAIAWAVLALWVILRIWNRSRRPVSKRPRRNSKPSTMPEVRTFGQLWGHLAQAQFGQCSAAAGVPNPSQGKQLEPELKTKAEFAKALADSFAICDKAFAAFTDQNAIELTPAFS